MKTEATLLKQENIIELPYSEKQLIVVVPDDVKIAEIQGIQKAESSDSSDEKAVPWWNYAIDAIRVVSPLKLNFYGLGIEFVIGMYKGIQKLREKNQTIVTTVSCSSSNQLIFPPGHPQKKCVYVGNPVDPLTYYPFADFHRMMRESKFTEIVNILMSLGAIELKVEKLSGENTDLSYHETIEVPTADNVGKKFDVNRKKERTYEFIANLNPKGDPRMPEKLSWYPFEPMWQMVSQGRLQHGLKNFTLKVKYLEDFGINADLNASIKGVGLTIGGNFSNHESTVWKITGIFVDIERTSGA